MLNGFVQMIQITQPRLADECQHPTPSFRRVVIVINAVVAVIMACIMNMYIPLLEFNVKKMLGNRNPLQWNQSNLINMQCEN